MYDKRIKFAGGTFNDSFTSLDKIQHIHTSICFVKNLWGVIRSGFLRVGGNEAKSVCL